MNKPNPTAKAKTKKKAMPKKKNILLLQMQSIQSNSHGWYKNIGLIGKGGNGIAFLVLCTGGDFKGQIFALKILTKISSPKRIERFEQEINFLKEQNHPSLMQEFDRGLFNGRPFVIMNYLPNTLTTEIRKGITLGTSLVYATQLLSALNFLHTRNIIHRDIKPQNIFINNSSAMLGDFGLIKKLQDNNDADDRKLLGDSIKIPAEDIKAYVAMPFFYRTPELVGYAKGEGVLHLSSDIFQLGLVLAEIFTGENPLKPAQNHLDPIELKQLKPIAGKYGKLISSTVGKMLNMNPQKRPSVEKLLDAFSGIYEQYATERLKLDGKVL